jgi:hypothetical protein
MQKRLFRHLGALGAMLAMLFGQFAVVAYACPVQSPAAPIVMADVAVHVGGGEYPCGGPDGAVGSLLGNACEVHCSDSVPPPAQPDLPQVSLVALPVPAIALAQLAFSGDAARTPHAALPGAPPLNLRFCRLLI